jgi:hypothetical protein
MSLVSSVRYLGASLSTLQGLGHGYYSTMAALTSVSEIRGACRRLVNTYLVTF